MGKRHSSRQDVLLLTETGDIADGKLEVPDGSSHVASPDTLQAWELDYGQQFKGPNRFIQVISDRSKKPLRVFKSRAELNGQSTEVIASQKQDEELAFLNSYHEQNKMLLWVGIIAALFAVVISIVVLTNMNGSPKEAAMNSVGFITTSAIWQAIKGNNKKEDIESEDGIGKISGNGNKSLVNCLIIVEKTGGREYRNVSRDLIPAESLERKYHGQATHLLGLDLDNKLWAIEPDNEIKKNDSPKDCFIALQYEKEVSALFSISEGLVEKIKIGIFITLCIVELIVLFLIITAASGGSV